MKDSPIVPRLVVCAANRQKEFIICGARHFDGIMRMLIRDLGLEFADWEQGFIDNRGVFMTREEAWIVAKEAGQIRRNVSTEGILYSENLY